MLLEAASEDATTPKKVLTTEQEWYLSFIFVKKILRSSYPFQLETSSLEGTPKRQALAD